MIDANTDALHLLPIQNPSGILEHLNCKTEILSPMQLKDSVVGKCAELLGVNNTIVLAGHTIALRPLIELHQHIWAIS